VVPSKEIKIGFQESTDQALRHPNCQTPGLRIMRPKTGILSGNVTISPQRHKEHRDQKRIHRGEKISGADARQKSFLSLAFILTLVFSVSSVPLW